MWADSTDQSRLVDSVLKDIGYESRMQGEGSCQYPLSGATKARNGERAKTRSRVEHILLRWK